MVQGINGGVFLLRPCAAVEAHMAALLEAHPKLRFTHSTAEQDFFGWYYRYTGATLPIQYNCQAEQALGADGLTGARLVQLRAWSAMASRGAPCCRSHCQPLLLLPAPRRLTGCPVAAAAAAGCSGRHGPQDCALHP